MDDAKQHFKHSIQKMDENYQNKLKSLKQKLDKHHLDQIAQLNAHKALVDNDIEAFMQDMEAG